MPTVSDQHVDRLRTLVAGRLGLRFDDRDTDHLAGILAGRIRASGSASADSYLRGLGSDHVGPGGEWRELANALTVAETYFFRHPDHFRAFAEVALPARLRERGGVRRLRVLSAGCASGEEAYSLAMLIHEAVPDLPAWDVRVTGIDVSSALLERAARARYTEWSLRATPPSRRQRSFSAEGREHVVNQAIRAMVSFEERNLLEDAPQFWRPESFDIVFFRNVAIYFAPEVTRAVIARIARSIVPGGFLFLGPSETLRGLSHAFHLRHSHETFYYQRGGPEQDAAGAGPAGAASRTPVVPPEKQADAPDESWMTSIQGAAARIARLTDVARRGRVGGPGAAGEPGRSAETVRPGRAAEPATGGGTAQSGHLAAARELLRQERFEEVMAVLQALPPQSPADPDALLLRAVVLTNGGKIAEAEQVCRQVLAADELNAGAHYLLALCRDQTGDREAAVQHDQTAIYLDAAFAMPRLHLGLVARRAGDREMARRQLQQALVLLEQEDASRILLFGGGFQREALVGMCRAELRGCGGAL